MLTSTVLTLLLVTAGNEPANASLDAVGALGLACQMGLCPNDRGAQDNNAHCSGTLVTPSVVLTARHCYGAVGWTGTFAFRLRRHLDGSLGSIAAGPSSYHQVLVTGWYIDAEDDIALAYLAQPVTHVLPIPLSFAEPPSTAPLLLAGWGMEGPGLNEGPRGRLLSCDSFRYFGSGLHFPAFWDPAGPGCGPNNGDSGGAVLHNGFAIGAIVGSGVASPVWLQADDPAFQALTLSGNDDKLP